ncbi:hypothetical protein D3P07_14110 [Paenibacillus sp. 1011MAR3C5]|uniref:hypothetical protein n=1 Tax=Paenibacillus sp. 1011MAR3C5 TaxID=1675787 RepID=UPI000E6BCE68|nr:hypothetical protein [Paenibacillus sp. 1011MAR3C5]RJE87466.1 hypothetical protein D3P07_14110 [Paenibacillus sp. 1011MAR3C5]
MKTVYVNVRHFLFWYGVYGFCEKSCNDEISLYADKERNLMLGYFDISTEPCLRHMLEHELDREEDRELFEEIETFLQGSSEVAYSFIYPRDKGDLANQVEHDAPVNEHGHRPVYISMFSKHSSAWDIREIEKSIYILNEDFLHLEIGSIEFLDIPTREETKASFELDYEPYI